MKEFFLIFVILLANVSGGGFVKVVMIFVGSDVNDTRELSFESNFNSINGTKYFNNNYPSIMIVHGNWKKYLDETGGSLITVFKNRGGFNVIFADWSEYKLSNRYGVLIRQLSEIATAYISLLSRLKSVGYDLKQIYPIGHTSGSKLYGRIALLLK